MSEGEYSTKTVAQLKTILQERDLPVSGKKADLVSRLIENDASSTSKTVEDNDSLEDLPFLSAVMKNGFGSVEIDRHVAIRYGSTFFMFIFIIIGLNSTS